MGFNPQVLVTDGYGGYRSLLSKRWPNMSHQSCLIHFRREIIEALNLPALGKEIKKLDDQGVAELGRRWLKEQDPSMKMLAVLDGLSTVYHLEELQRDPQESDEQYLERVRLNRRDRVKRSWTTSTVSCCRWYRSTRRSRTRNMRKRAARRGAPGLCTT